VAEGQYIFKELRSSILEYDKAKASELARKIVESGIDIIQSLNIIAEAMKYIGDRFKEEELWLPDLIGASDTVKIAMPILEKEIERKNIKINAECVVVIGTVYGDIHNIGKDMVSTLFRSSGFQVYDLGVDVKTEQFINATTMYHADILAMSSLLTTNISEMKKVIDALERDNLRETVSVIVGGGAINEEFAKQLGADGYEPTAIEAVELVSNLIKKR
jgi:methanogenic corrinoid protein MtbC1